MTVDAFQSLIYPQGLHLSRCRIPMDLGTWQADPNATFRQGQLVSLNASGLVVKNTSGTNILGVAKWTKDTGVGNAVAVDEPVVLTGVAVTALNRGSIVGTAVNNNSIKVSLTAGGAALTVTVDYTVDSLSNGTLHREAAGAIASGSTVYVSYTYALTSSDLDFQGRNFWNLQDDVTIQAGRVAVIQDHALLFSTEYAANRRYQVNDLLYAGQTDAEDQGLVTNDSGEGEVIGKVVQVPTATDPYLGWAYIQQLL